MTLVILPEALAELLSSASWYDEQRVGLGKELVDEAWAVLGRVRGAPASFGRYELYRGPEEIRRAG